MSVALWSSHVACYRRGGPLCPPSKQVTTGVTPTSGRLGAIGAVSGMKMGNMIVPGSSPSTGLDRQGSSLLFQMLKPSASSRARWRHRHNRKFVMIVPTSSPSTGFDRQDSSLLFFMMKPSARSCARWRHRHNQDDPWSFLAKCRPRAKNDTLPRFADPLSREGYLLGFPLGGCLRAAG